MSNIFYTSDHHFCHKSVIAYENRPFKDVDEMNKYMIKQWNSVVKNDDVVYHLGDFGFAPIPDLRSIRSELKGRIFIIKGNHDGSNTRMNSIGFNKVYDHSIIINEFMILSHKPVYLRSLSPFVNLHGHIHSKKIVGADYFNVSVEHNDYKPFSHEEIVSVFKNKLEYQIELEYENDN